MKLAIVGSRDFEDYELCKKTILKNFNINAITEIVSGGAKGADSLGEKFAKENNIKLTTFLPDWDKFGKKAGFLRNTTIVENSDIIIAFWKNKSKGTQDTISKARKTNKIVIIMEI